MRPPHIITPEERERLDEEQAARLRAEIDELMEFNRKVGIPVARPDGQAGDDGRTVRVAPETHIARSATTVHIVVPDRYRRPEREAEATRIVARRPPRRATRREDTPDVTDRRVEQLETLAARLRAEAEIDAAVRVRDGRAELTVPAGQGRAARALVASIWRREGGRQ